MCRTFLLLILSFISTPLLSKTIVVWNVKPQFYEGVNDRSSDYEQLSIDLDPDILVLVEVVGRLEVETIAKSLGWKNYYIAVSDFSVGSFATFASLEVAVISKIPIVGATEYDTALDGRTHPVLKNEDPVTGISVNELELSSDGISGFGSSLSHHQRGTMQIDLDNGLSIFPVHLQSNRNGSCADLEAAKEVLHKQQFKVCLLYTSPSPRDS